jgi:hypothetical protein
MRCNCSSLIPDPASSVTSENSVAMIPSVGNAQSAASARDRLGIGVTNKRGARGRGFYPNKRLSALASVKTFAVRTSAVFPLKKHASELEAAGVFGENTTLFLGLWLLRRTDMRMQEARQ